MDYTLFYGAKVKKRNLQQRKVQWSSLRQSTQTSGHKLTSRRPSLSHCSLRQRKMFDQQNPTFNDPVGWKSKQKLKNKPLLIKKACVCMKKLFYFFVFFFWPWFSRRLRTGEILRGWKWWSFVTFHVALWGLKPTPLCFLYVKIWFVFEKKKKKRICTL